MKTIIVAISALAVAAAGAAQAQRHDDSHDHGHWRPGHDDRGGGGHAGWGRDFGGGHHWRNGERMGWNDWHSAPVVDYRIHHLRRPPPGYEWRESNGQYVLAAVATGLIASIIIASQH